MPARRSTMLILALVGLAMSGLGCDDGGTTNPGEAEQGEDAGADVDADAGADADADPGVAEEAEVDEPPSADPDPGDGGAIDDGPDSSA